MDGVNETIKLIESEVRSVKNLAIKADMTNLEDVQRMVSETVKAFGSLDYGEIDQWCNEQDLTLLDSRKYRWGGSQPSLTNLQISP